MPCGARALRGAWWGSPACRAASGWARFRAFGAAALELSAVADGTLDAFVVGTHASLAPWDYLGAMLGNLLEAGAVIDELTVTTS